MDEKRAKAHLQPSAETLAGVGAHPLVCPSLPRGSVRSPDRLPAGRARTHARTAPGAGSATLALRNLEHVAAAQPLVVCRSAVPARLHAVQGAPASAYWMTPTLVTPPHPIMAPSPAPTPKAKGL